MTEQQHRTATPTTAGTNGTHGPSSDNPLAKLFASSRRWVLWRSEKVDGRLTKVCYQVDGRKAASTRPAEWSTLAQVQAKQAKHDGIGLMFAPDRQLIGIDLDHVVDQGAITDPASRDLVEAVRPHADPLGIDAGSPAFPSLVIGAVIALHHQPPEDLGMRGGIGGDGRGSGRDCEGQCAYWSRR